VPMSNNCEAEAGNSVICQLLCVAGV
jgi:hypothetical protein